MASGNYNPYSYGPNQQSSAQQYSAYQTAAASDNIAQSSRQYQSNHSVVTTRPTDYLSYQAQSYGGEGSGYGGGAQDNAWGGSTYNGNRETASRAAEVLRNMSNNTNYATNNSTTVSAPTLSPANAATANTARYSSGAPQEQQGDQSPQTQTAHSTYGQSQASPRSPNTNPTQTASSRGLPSPAIAASYPQLPSAVHNNQQPQRSTSPAQSQYAQSMQTPVSSVRSAVISAATNQYNDHNRNMQLPNLDATCTALTPAVSAAYNYADDQATAPMQATSSHVSDSYNQGTNTVDPMAVYDPWPEYQRKQEALRVQKAVEDAARAEEERNAGEARREGERKHEEERRQEEKGEEERARQVQSRQATRAQAQANNAEASSTSAAMAAALSSGSDMEVEIRALMAKMREFNSKDPALLARIWEEERRAKTPKSPTVQSKTTAQPAPALPSAQAASASGPPAANQRNNTAQKDAITPNAAKTATPITAPAVVKPAVASARTRGTTIWPEEKKSQLAAAAVSYLNAQNPDKNLTPGEILAMLDGNPSYIELCEQLEANRVKLDRAAFAKNLLTAVPDVNSASKLSKPAQGLTPGPVMARVIQKTHTAPPAIMKKNIATPAAASPRQPPAVASAANRPYPPFPDNHISTAPVGFPVAQMIPIKPELKPPANKEEAARKRTFSDLIDLTQLDEEDAFQPLQKKANIGSTLAYNSAIPSFVNDMALGGGPPAPTNFPITASVNPRPVPEASTVLPPAVNELRHLKIVEPLDRNKALRRNTYNIKTIARDVLMACGRHPESRQLNQHLEILKDTLPQVTNDSDLSTLRWDLIDPGAPPPGYFKDRVQTLAEDADDEDNSNDEGRDKEASQRMSLNGQSAVSTRVPSFGEPTNPFKKRRGRPQRARHSYPDNQSIPSTPTRTISTNMSASPPRSAVAAAGVGYSAFRAATEYGPDGQPLPKKRGRPVGWRKAIHGSAAAQAQPGRNKFTGPSRSVPTQPSTLRNVGTRPNEPIRIDSRSPSVQDKTKHYPSYKCEWQNCQAELHNLETLKKHVQKVHGKETAVGTLECLWNDCGKETASHDIMTNMRIERHEPKSFTNEADWRAHLEDVHFSPLSWQLGDGPASGLSDANDCEAYLSDAQGRRVTPRITPLPAYLEDNDPTAPGGAASGKVVPTPRGRGRPPKTDPEREARELQNRVVLQKKRVGGPGIDRGGATLVNDKRRKGFSDRDDTEEELVDAED